MNQKLLGVLRLIRFSNTPTAVADVVAGYMLAVGTIIEWPPLLALALTSVCLYSFGMVLNDLNDLQDDRVSNPRRPLVTGVVSIGEARWIVGTLVAIAVLAAGGAGWLYQASVLGVDSLKSDASAVIPPWAWTLALALCLIVAIWLYDGPLKRSFVAPFVMGSCRGLNLLLGASLPGLSVPELNEANTVILGPWTFWTTDVWLCAMAMTSYVTGITWYARSESSGPQRWHLCLGLLFLSLGVFLLAFGLMFVSDRPFGRAAIGTWQKFEIWWPLAMILLTYSVLRKAINGVIVASESTVRTAIVTALGSLVFLNGAICLYANPQQWQVAAAVAALMIPIRFLRSTISPT
jgi:4-hydroxybenzoate polyprenyltransferase